MAEFGQRKQSEQKAVPGLNHGDRAVPKSSAATSFFRLPDLDVFNVSSKAASAILGGFAIFANFLLVLDHTKVGEYGTAVHKFSITESVLKQIKLQIGNPVGSTPMRSFLPLVNPNALPKQSLPGGGLSPRCESQGDQRIVQFCQFQLGKMTRGFPSFPRKRMTGRSIR